MKIDDKTYELILPEFEKFENHSCLASNKYVSDDFPFQFFIGWQNKRHIFGYITLNSCTIFGKNINLDHPITETDYNNMVHELQQAYKDWVFETLFKEIKQ